MNISAMFIHRPVATILLIIGLVMAGSFAYRLLPVAALPQADFPTISVSAQLAGASPDTMASSVATPLIKQFQTIAGISSISASSSLGSTSITVQFDLSRNIDAAAADIQAAIARTQRQLPANLTTPPSYRKSNPADFPVMFLALTSDTAPLTRIDDIAQNIISPAISTVDGVAQAQVFGSKTYAVRVGVDPDKLAARGLSMNSLSTALANANNQSPVGTLQNDSQSLTINVPTQRTNADSFKTLVIARPNGKSIYLQDVATVADSVANLNSGSWFDGKPGIVLAIQRQPGANTVAVVDAIKAKLPELEADLPTNMSIQVVSDASTSIRSAITDVQETLALTIGLVILVIYLFVGRLYATMIPGLTVPLSLIATAGGMYLLGFSINNISLLGLTLSVGLVVDDAIVMLENIVRKMEEGMSPMQAALEGSKEVTGTIISMSLSLVAVFLPVLLMGGVVGRVLNEFGLVVTMAILASAVVSLTVTPMLAARLPQVPHTEDKKTTFSERMARLYERSVEWCLDWQYTILIIFFATFAGSAYMMVTLPKSFIPTEDIGTLNVSTQARQDISYPAMLILQQQVASIVAQNPAVVHVVSSLGSGPGSGSVNSGSVLIQLKPKSERPPLDQTLGELRKALSAVAGLKTFIMPQQSLRFGGRSSQSQYQVVLQSLDADVTRQWSASLMAAMTADTAHFSDVATDLQNGALQAQISVDAARADSLGISAATLRTTLQAGFGTSIATQIQTTGNSYNVILEFDRSKEWDEESLTRIRVPNANGTMIPLSAFASVSRTSGPVTVNQTGQLTAVTLSFNLPAGVSLGTATDRIDSLKSEIGMPPTVLTSFAGTAQVFQQSTSNTPMLIAAAIITIYVVLGVLYESFWHPITILSGLPSAALGALLALKLYNLDFSIIALIGLLMLIGIVKKNAIMMIDVALSLQREQGYSPHDAIVHAARLRFRPIMMTTFCALLGALPIALGTGASSELRQPLGIAVVGGLMISQVLTLFITPVIYVQIERLASFVRRLAGHERENRLIENPLS